jgi:putative ABC transport system permease protein
MRQGRLLTGSGAVIGVAVAYFSGRVVTSRLYEVRAADPVILGAAALVVAGFAIMATTIPAYRASRLNPVRVLRPD